MLGKFFNKKGTTLVEVLVAAVLIAVASSGLLSALSAFYTQKAIKDIDNSIVSQKEKIIELLNARNSWTRIIANNGLTCLQSAGISCASGTQEIAVYDSNNIKLTDSSANDFGSDRYLNSCAFSGSNCDFRFLISWSPICESAATCMSPLIKVMGTLQVNSGISNLVPNPSKYDFNFIRGTISNNAVMNCQSLGGSYDSSTNHCFLPSANQTCPQGNIVVGINANGTIICEPLIDFECPANTYAKGVNPDGTLLCLAIAGACPVDGSGNLTPPGGFNPDPNAGFTTSVGGGDGGCGDGGGDCN